MLRYVLHPHRRRSCFVSGEPPASAGSRILSDPKDNLFWQGFGGWASEVGRTNGLLWPGRTTSWDVS